MFLNEKSINSDDLVSIMHLGPATENDSIKASRDKLKKEADVIIKTKKIKVIFDVKKGVPSEVILSEHKAKKIDLIVIASHGKTGILKRLMGSVADKVVEGSKCPVMVVKF